MTTTTDSRPPTCIHSLGSAYIQSLIHLVDAPMLPCGHDLRVAPDLALWTLTWSVYGGHRETTVSLHGVHGENPPEIVSCLTEGKNPIPDWIPRPDWVACVAQLFPDGPDHG